MGHHLRTFPFVVYASEELRVSFSYVVILRISSMDTSVMIDQRTRLIANQGWVEGISFVG